MGEEAGAGGKAGAEEHGRASGVVKLRGGGHVFFVSDVRTADWTLMTPDEVSSANSWASIVPTQSDSRCGVAGNHFCGICFLQCCGM